MKRPSLNARESLRMRILVRALLTSAMLFCVRPALAAETENLSDVLSLLAAHNGVHYTIECIPHPRNFSEYTLERTETAPGIVYLNRWWFHQIEQMTGSSQVAFKPRRINADEFLKRYVPGVAVQKSSIHAGIFHVIDKRLLGRKNYPLDQRLPYFKFTGNLVTLMESLSSKFPDFTCNRDFTMPGIWPYGGLTLPVAIEGKNLSLREIVTKVLPSERRPVMWVAVTYPEKSDTKITFYQQNPEPEISNPTPQPPG